MSKKESAASHAVVLTSKDSSTAESKNVKQSQNLRPSTLFFADIHAKIGCPSFTEFTGSKNFLKINLDSIDRSKDNDLKKRESHISLPKRKFMIRHLPPSYDFSDFTKLLKNILGKEILHEWIEMYWIIPGRPISTLKLIQTQENDQLKVEETRQGRGYVVFKKEHLDKIPLFAKKIHGYRVLDIGSFKQPPPPEFNLSEDEIDVLEKTEYENNATESLASSRSDTPIPDKIHNPQETPSFSLTFSLAPFQGIPSSLEQPCSDKLDLLPEYQEFLEIHKQLLRSRNQKLKEQQSLSAESCSILYETFKKQIVLTKETRVSNSTPLVQHIIQQDKELNLGEPSTKNQTASQESSSKKKRKKKSKKKKISENQKKDSIISEVSSSVLDNPQISTVSNSSKTTFSGSKIKILTRSAKGELIDVNFSKTSQVEPRFTQIKTGNVKTHDNPKNILNYHEKKETQKPENNLTAVRVKPVVKKSFKSMAASSETPKT